MDVHPKYGTIGFDPWPSHHLWTEKHWNLKPAASESKVSVMHTGESCQPARRFPVVEIIHNWLVVVYLPLWKIWLSQLGWLFRQDMGKLKNVPNHQPDKSLYVEICNSSIRMGKTSLMANGCSSPQVWNGRNTAPHHFIVSVGIEFCSHSFAMKTFLCRKLRSWKCHDIIDIMSHM